MPRSHVAIAIVIRMVSQSQSRWMRSVLSYVFMAIAPHEQLHEIQHNPLVAMKMSQSQSQNVKGPFSGMRPVSLTFQHKWPSDGMTAKQKFCFRDRFLSVYVIFNQCTGATTTRTRMHSSRMRTGRSLTVCCSLLPGGVCSGGVCSWGGVFSQGGVWSRGVCVCLLQGGGCLLRGGVCSGGVHPSMHWGRHPPPLWTEFLTHACENITLAQLRCGR